MLSGPPGDSPGSVVGHLLAVQAQDERAFRLAVRSRTRGLLATDVDRALDQRRLVVTWLNRGTLHLVRAEDYRWLHTLTAPRVVARVERRLRQLGVDAGQTERGVATIVGSLESEGPLTRHQLRDRLSDDGVPTGGQALVHLLAITSLRGLTVRGPMVDGRHAFVSVADWLGPSPTTVDRDESLGRLALRYLTGHGPAAPGDLAAWAGITLGDARTGFARVLDQLDPVGDGSVRRTGADGDATPPPVRLLGAFDPLLHGWASRELFVGRHGSVVTTNGIFRPVCLVGGRAVATWRISPRGVQLRPLEDIDDTAMAQVADDARDVARYLGMAAVGLVGPED